MAFQQLVKFYHLIPNVPCQQFAHQSARSITQSLIPRTSICGKLYYHLATVHGGHLETSKMRPCLLSLKLGKSFGLEKSSRNFLNQACNKHNAIFALQKNVSYTRYLSTSAVKACDVSRGNNKVSKKSPFDFLSLQSFLSTPAPFMVYGISGLIPFVSVPVYMFLTSTYCSTLAFVQLVYGACILSFLGGVPWGKALTSPEQATYMSLGYSVFLPLVGWVGVIMYPNISAFPIMISGIAFAGIVDTQVINHDQWFKNLRFLLTSLVTLSLLGTFIISLGKDTKKKSTEKS